LRELLSWGGEQGSVARVLVAFHLEDPEAAGVDSGSAPAVAFMQRGTLLRAPGNVIFAQMRKTYITPEGAAKLQQELRELWNSERPRVTREVAEAAALGDRSENAEYIYGKKRLREIDRRVRFLTKRLGEVTIARPGEVADRERIFFGAWVTLEDEKGEDHRYRLVGPDEIDPALGLISVVSPMGRVLLGKEVGDEVTVERPAGAAAFSVVEISYDAD